MFVRTSDRVFAPQMIRFSNQPEKTSTIVPTIKHYPPDTVAGIFWLKNRQPDKWREKQEIAIEDTTVRIVKKRFDAE